jgi:RNA polymerase sigma-70 factor (ECF subfamily)
MVITDDRVEPALASDLLARARAGEAEAFCLLTEPLQAALLRQAVALAGNLGTAEDLVAETLVAAWNSLPRYNETCRLSTWLYAILLHRHHKWLRRARSRPISLAWLPFFQAREWMGKHRELASGELSPVEVVVQGEVGAEMRRCVEQLPEKHRRVIWLRFFEEASLPDMAVVLGCSVGTVKSRLHHALEKLRKMKMNLPPLKGDKPV